MTKETPIRNFYGKTLGYIRTDEKGNKTVFDFYKRILGYYDAKRDVTMDFYKRDIARGDATGMLIKDE